MDIIHSGFIFVDFECATIHLYHVKIFDRRYILNMLSCTIIIISVLSNALNINKKQCDYCVLFVHFLDICVVKNTLCIIWTFLQLNLLKCDSDSSSDQKRPFFNLNCYDAFDKTLFADLNGTDFIIKSRSSGGRVVKLLASGARGPAGVRFPASPLEFSEIGYLLLPSRDMAERSINRR